MTERGSFTVEAALVIPVMVIVLVAVFEIVAAVAVRLDLVAAAREGARVAATVPAPERAVAVVREVLPEAIRSRARVSVTRSAVVGSSATVIVRLDLPLRTPLLDRLRIPLEGRAVMRVER